jgi:hypothetical protein
MTISSTQTLCVCVCVRVRSVETNFQRNQDGTANTNVYFLTSYQHYQDYIYLILTEHTLAFTVGRGSLRNVIKCRLLYMAEGIDGYL